MTHTVMVTLLALSLNGTPFQPKATRSHAKPPPVDNPTPPPPQEKPPQNRPEPEEPRPEKPDRDDPSRHVFDMSDVLPVIQNDQLQVQSCYSRARARSPQVQGEVVVDFDISPDGRVERESVSQNTTGDTELGRCILQLVKSWQFPRRDSFNFTVPPFHVTHPFRFQAL